MVGWAPSIVVGASVGLARRFSASGWLPRRAALRRHVLQLHRQAAVVPRRDPRACRRRRQHAAGRVRQRRLARGGRAVRDAASASRSSTRSARPKVASPSTVTPRCASGSVGKAGETVKIVDDDGRRAARAEFDDDGALLNADECVGEIVNTAGAGPFEGYYNNDEATATTTAQRLVLVGRPRLRRRRRLPVLRRAHRRLDPRRRRELPGRPDRDAPSVDIPTSCSPRSTACPTSTRAIR